jgi:hypothetical protein
MTTWADDVDPGKVHDAYPRPQMERAQWRNLNGLWEYAITARTVSDPDSFQGKILVPFPLESALSGVKARIADDQALWYTRTFQIPDDWKEKRILLHFEAVDWEARVWINNQEVGIHRGGYDPFSFDITGALEDTLDQTIRVMVWDPTDRGAQARGKQVSKPGGIWYTPTTGIWQTVWIEPVDARHVRDLRMIPDVDNKKLILKVAGSGPAGGLPCRVYVENPDGREAVFTGTVGELLDLPLENLRLWSPEDPHLYPIRVEILDGKGTITDRVNSYFGMRKISLERDDEGKTRIFLNDTPIFMLGTLDQGFWPDGLYSPPTDEALRYDLEVTRDLGFNMIRKHVKVESRRWYTWCDRMGLLVWQDMPSRSRNREKAEKWGDTLDSSDRQFEQELKALVDAHFNAPCIVVWVPFNEGWGQYDDVRIVQLIRDWDSSRLINNASGWHDRGEGDIKDIHAYPGPAGTQPEADRAAVLGEFGGLGLPLSGHTWQPEKNWGYRTFSNADTLTASYENLLRRLFLLKAEPGLSAAVYTQTTDVEIEVNGLMTYDRALTKMDRDRVHEVNTQLYQKPPRIVSLVPTSMDHSQTWRFTFEEPDTNWALKDFDDSAWNKGPGGFGKPGTPGSAIRTLWTNESIWIRRGFVIEEAPEGPLYLHIHHDEDARVYIDGERVADLEGYVSAYTFVPLETETGGKLSAGEHVLAIYCRQTGGGQYIDAGLVYIVP